MRGLVADTRLTFDNWRMLDEAFFQLQEDPDSIQLEQNARKILNHLFIDVDNDITNTMLSWLSKWWISEISPRAEAKILWDIWESRYGEYCSKWGVGQWNGISQNANSGYIYVLQMGQFYKIGKANNILARFPQLAIKMPMEIRLRMIYCVNDVLREEHAMHRFYHRYHTNGEWFTFPQDLLMLLKDQEPTTYGGYQYFSKEIANDR